MQERTTAIKISETDLRIITSLLENIPRKKRDEFEELEKELLRADVLPADQMPSDVVTMYSSVVYEDLANGKLMTVQLTYPKDSNLEEGRISIFTPIGAALLGLQAGQDIAWPLPDGRLKRVRVTKLTQPLEPTPGALEPTQSDL